MHTQVNTITSYNNIEEEISSLDIQNYLTFQYTEYYRPTITEIRESRGCSIMNIISERLNEESSIKKLL